MNRFPSRRTVLATLAAAPAAVALVASAKAQEAMKPAAEAPRPSGSVDMAELVAIRSPFGLPIERDLYWQPRPLTECLR